MSGIKNWKSFLSEGHVTIPLTGLMIGAFSFIIKTAVHAMKNPDVNLFKLETPQERYRDKQYVKWNVSGRRYVTLAPEGPDYIDAEYEKIQSEKENNGRTALEFKENRTTSDSIKT